MNGGLERYEGAREWENGQEHVQHLRRRITALWVAVVVLAVALAGIIGYGYLALQKHSVQFSQLPGLTESLTLVGERVDAAEDQLRAWAADWNRLQERVAKLDRKVAYNRKLARKQTQEMTAQLQQRIEAELDQRSQAIDARFRQLESGGEAARASLAQLRERVAALRTDTGRDLSRLHEELARSEGQRNELVQKLERQRVDFEMAGNRTRELAPGISLRVTGTNVSRQQVKGWMWLMPDRKALWLQDLAIQRPLVFYHKDGRGPNELVITNVARDSVAGYLLLPAAAGAEATASAPGAGEPQAATPAGGLDQ